MPRISPDNKIIHGMWYGKQLSRMELLTLHSFTHHGHEFHLWAYDDLTHHDLPRGVTLLDAEEIIPRKDVFVKTRIDPETGVGRNSLGAPFSDLFRYKLLQKKGGIWVDMDVTCLKPFDFESEYVFRPHRIGVVGSILKSPKNSKFIRRVHDETVRSVGPDSDYLLPNRILTHHVQDMGLAQYIIDEISNPDHFMDYIRPLIEGPAEIPDSWRAIHWINEMWRTLASDDGLYRGQRLLNYVPDKNQPIEHSVLWEFYRKYGLLEARQGGPRPATLPAMPGRKIHALPVRALARLKAASSALNMLLPSLVRGGAERSVLEIMNALQKRPELQQNLFVLHRSRRQYPAHSADNLKVHFATDPWNRHAAMQEFGWAMLEGSQPLVFAHMFPVEDLRHLWAMGVSTVPVIQNMSPGWNDPATAFNDPHIPFVVGVSDAVSEELRKAGCARPVITLRHELQRQYSPQDLAKHRRDIRHRHGIEDNTLLIGMIGQFKSQKAYTRAVRVLHRVREFLPAKLMIVGGWDHEYGGGRAAYEATCRRAVELGVIADMVMPGDVHPSDPYLAAFDVFLNTSIYEGLSVAMLEAIATGCPIVTADAGGNREALPEDAALIEDGADIEAYAQAILKAGMRANRVLPAKAPDRALVPRLWSLMARHGIQNPEPLRARPTGTLFITQNLQLGGAQKSLVQLAGGLAAHQKVAVCILEGEPLGSLKQKLDAASVPMFSAREFESVVDKAEHILASVDGLNIRNICFWNVMPELKLLLAKVLSLRDIRLFDVSPGQMLFDELDAARNFQRRVSLDVSRYFERLDGFVAKFKGGGPPKALRVPAGKIHVIPNGVATPPNYIPLPPPLCMLPEDLDPALAIGTCARIVPDKRFEFLLDTMAILNARSPGTSLTIVGSADRQSTGYFEGIQAEIAASGIRNIFFVGAHENVLPFLAQFRIFVMVSDRQGCPNASLEAMSMGLPVISNTSGGVAEQIEDGVTGYLISTPQQMADRILELQKNTRLRRKMGNAARARALKQFSQEKMISAYAKLLGE